MLGMFTAAQATQKSIKASGVHQPVFTAAQAAQKILVGHGLRLLEFTLAPQRSASQISLRRKKGGVKGAL